MPICVVEECEVFQIKGAYKLLGGVGGEEGGGVEIIQQWSVVKHECINDKTHYELK